MSGQFSGQVPNFNGQNNPSVMDTEVLRIGCFMRDKIYETLMLRQSQTNEAFSKRCQDITKRLEEGLFKSATTKEEYMNMNTLETLLQALVKQPTPTNHTPQHSQFINATIPSATMMPTPGMPQNVNPNVNVSSAVAPTMMTANTDGGMSSSIPKTGNLMSTVNGSFSGMHGGSFRAGEGSLSNGYQQSASNFSMNSGENNMMAGQRPMSQMVPTPGYSGSNNQTLTNVENTNKGMFSGSDFSVVSQQMPQRQASG